jgi:hypothetical protein
MRGIQIYQGQRLTSVESGFVWVIFFLQNERILIPWRAVKGEKTDSILDPTKGLKVWLFKPAVIGYKALKKGNPRVFDVAQDPGIAKLSAPWQVAMDP